MAAPTTRRLTELLITAPLTPPPSGTPQLKLVKVQQPPFAQPQVR